MVCSSVGNITNLRSRPYAGSLHMLIYLILGTTQQARDYDVQFSEKETEAQRGETTCPSMWQNDPSSTLTPRPWPSLVCWNSYGTLPSAENLQRSYLLFAWASGMPWVPMSWVRLRGYPNAKKNEKKKKKPGIRSHFFLNSTNTVIIRGEKNQWQQSVVILGHTVQSSMILSEAQQALHSNACW